MRIEFLLEKYNPQANEHWMLVDSKTSIRPVSVFEPGGYMESYMEKRTYRTCLPMNTELFSSDYPSEEYSPDWRLISVTRDNNLTEVATFSSQGPNTQRFIQGGPSTEERVYVREY